MKILVVGSGGREHAIIEALSRSASVTELFCAPGNAGIAEKASCVPVDITPEALKDFAFKNSIDLTIIGPEVPLVAGVVDVFEAAGLRVFGPNKQAAQLEGSKRFSKAFMERHNIPSATHRSFTDSLSALTYLESVPLPTVIKDSNLAAGKGVTITDDLEQARSVIENILGAPEGGELVIESFLNGQEISFLIFTDGHSYKPMLLAQDYKQAFEGDTGPMTGGMGTIAPVNMLTQTQYDYICTHIIERTLSGLKQENIHYKGVLFIGLMINGDSINVLEYNVRFGDPETQVVLPLLKTDLLDVMNAVIDERLHDITLEWSSSAAACVVMAAPGYPGSYPKGIPIGVPGDLAPNVKVIHAGTRLQDGQLVSDGGRVLNVTAVSDDLSGAVRDAYAAVKRISFANAHYRRDIGQRVLASD